jgi:phosphatidylglycerophosphate synthase
MELIFRLLSFHCKHWTSKWKAHGSMCAILSLLYKCKLLLWPHPRRFHSPFILALFLLVLENSIYVIHKVIFVSTC